MIFYFFTKKWWDGIMKIYTEKNIEQSPFTNLIYSTPHIYHKHSFWEITIVLMGKSINVMNNAPKVELERGNALIIRPNDCHFIRPLDDPHNYTHRDIYISIEKFRNICNLLDPFLYNQLENEPIPPSFNLSEAEILSLNSHFNHFLTPNKQHANMEAIHTALVCYLLGLYIKSKSFSKDNIPEWLTNFLYKLHKPEYFTKQISEIVESTYFSYSYVCSKFKYYMHKTLNEYVMQLRMNYASSLLLTSNYTIVEIARILGYNSPTNFITAFKKHFKSPPKQWKKAQNSMT